MRLSSKQTLAIITTSILALCSTAHAERLSVEAPTNIPSTNDGYVVTELASGLESPYGMAFLPNGNALVTEKDGAVRLMKDDQLVDGDVAGVPEVYFKSQAGLFDIVLHPNFESNNYVYLTYAHEEGKKNTLRVARAIYRENDAAGELTNLEVIFTANAWRESSGHYGGKLVFLKDGTFLLTSGEGYRHKDQAQKLDNHFGKIIRLNDDGSAPQDNPFVGQKGALPEIWSYGHRNPQGLVYDAENDIVYETEHGPKGGDEINIITKGTNYGWPAICYCRDYSGASITPFTKLDNMEQSYVHYVPSIAPSGLTQYRGDKFPAWDGDLFIGALAGEHLRHVDMVDGAFGDQQKLISGLGERVRDIRTSPDGYLYVLTDKSDGKILKISPAQ